MSNVLEVVNLNVRFRIMSPFGALLQRDASPFIHAVAGVDLAVRQGETFALVGESGSGKSTLAMAISRMVTPDPGSAILINGFDAMKMSQRAFNKHRRHLAMMFQDPIGSLSPRMTVRSLLIEPFQVHGIKDRDLDAECYRLLDMVGLPRDFSHRYPHELSGGQARRVGVARALALDPQLIIADEPTAGLDVSVQGDVLNLLNELQERLGLTILIITHNLHVVRHIAHRTAIMYLGRIVEEGPTEDIFARPRHPYTQALLSAAPKPDPDAIHQRIQLKGEVPSLARRPQGCEFHTRCPYAREQCAQSRPAEAGAPQNHRYSCFYPLN